jgi:putative PIN family toxin of toxin-antitoxin system
MRVVVDTNIWISFLIGKKIIRLKDLIFSDSVTLLLSDESFHELIATLQRPYFQKYFPTEKIHELIVLLDVVCEKVEVVSQVTACRDPKDNFLLALCKDGKADYLLTSDNDLLELQVFEQTKIVDIKTFEMIHR